MQVVLPDTVYILLYTTVYYCILLYTVCILKKEGNLAIYLDGLKRWEKAVYCVLYQLSVYGLLPALQALQVDGQVALLLQELAQLALALVLPGQGDVVLARDALAAVMPCGCTLPDFTTIQL